MVVDNHICKHKNSDYHSLVVSPKSMIATTFDRNLIWTRCSEYPSNCNPSYWYVHLDKLQELYLVVVDRT